MSIMLKENLNTEKIPWKDLKEKANRCTAGQSGASAAILCFFCCARKSGPGRCLLGGVGSANRADAVASAAFDANIGIDDELVVSFADGLDGAFSCTSTARNAVFVDYVSHKSHLLRWDMVIIMPSAKKSKRGTDFSTNLTVFWQIFWRKVKFPRCFSLLFADCSRIFFCPSAGFAPHLYESGWAGLHNRGPISPAIFR